MANLFIGEVQLNTGNIKCNLSNYKINKTFNNAVYPRYKSLRPQIFPVSVQAEKYSFEIVLWGRGDIYNELLDKEREIFDEIGTQISNHDTVAFSSDSIPLYFNNTNIYLLFESTDYTRRGTDGKSFISLKFDCVFHSIGESNSNGNSIGIGSLAIASYTIGSG